MYLLYNKRTDDLGIWMEKWDVVAVRRMVPVRQLDKTLAWVEVETIMDYNLDWDIVGELEF